MAEQVGFSSELPLVLVEGSVAMAEQVRFSSELPLVLWRGVLPWQSRWGSALSYHCIGGGECCHGRAG